MCDDECIILYGLKHVIVHELIIMSESYASGSSLVILEKHKYVNQTGQICAPKKGIPLASNKLFRYMQSIKIR